jgi:hypothetical protein
MSSKLFKQIVQQASALDEIRDTMASTKNKKVFSKVTKLQSGGEEQVEKSALQSKVDSLLFFDTAFSNRTGNVHKSLERRQKSLEKEKKKYTRSKTRGEPVGNSRSSSSVYARKANVPTFNKKRHMKQKKIKDLEHLAKMLRKNKE